MTRVRAFLVGIGSDADPRAPYLFRTAYPRREKQSKREDAPLAHPNKPSRTGSTRSCFRTQIDGISSYLPRSIGQYDKLLVRDPEGGLGPPR